MDTNKNNVRLVGTTKTWPWWLGLLALLAVLILAYFLYEDLTTNEIEFVPTSDEVQPTAINEQAAGTPAVIELPPVESSNDRSSTLNSLTLFDPIIEPEPLVLLTDVLVTAVFADRTFVVAENGVSIRAQLIPRIDSPETETVIEVGDNVTIAGKIVSITSVNYKPTETVPAAVVLTEEEYLIQVARFE